MIRGNKRMIYMYGDVSQNELDKEIIKCNARNSKNL